MCKPLNPELHEHKILLNRIASGDVVLFLGSGFSLGAMGSLLDDEGKKIALPNVQQLKEILSNKILYTNKVDGTLKDICEDCQEDNCSHYAQIMRDLFRVSSFQKFHELYAEVNWKSIFTTNVDNLIERVFEEKHKQICSLYSENPKYKERGAVKYFKLHGDANIAPEQITFSTMDYISSSARRNDCRFEALTEALKTENFVFIGTSLSEEWDFDIKCQQADVYIISNKTYFVLKEYDDKLIKRIKRRFRNAVLIQETAESFISKVIDYISNCPIKVKNFAYDKCNLKHIQRKNYDVETYLKPDLYLGAEPTWKDIFSNHDVIWEKTRKAISETNSDERFICTLIVGKPISGKTTMLYRLGANFCEKYTVLEYLGDDFFEDIIQYKNDGAEFKQSSIILLDDANWILGRIEKLIDLLEDTNIYLIATVREKEYEKRQHLFDEMINSKIRVFSDINRLTTKDYGLYLDKLSEKSFLGQYSRGYEQSREDIVRELENEVKSKKEDPLLSLTYKMKFGNKMDQRISEISDLIVKHENYNLKRFMVMLYFLDVIGDTGLKLSLFLDLYPMDSEMLKEFMNEVEDLLISNINAKSWADSNYNKIIIHARFSEIVRKSIIKINYSELEELVEDIFRRMDDVHHFKCRQSNTYHNYVLYTLLRSQNISELFRNNKNRKIEWAYINKLYENLHEYFGDYHLYWLHRGISEVKMKNYASATIHLKQARVTRQSYSYEIEHSFAMLYFDQSIHSEKESLAFREGMLEKALEIIRLQIGRKENDAFSIHSFVIKTIQFYESIEQEVPEPLMKEILKYYYLARKRFSLDRSIIRRNMLMCIYKYLLEHHKEYDYNLSVTKEELTYFNRRIGANDVNYDILDLI